MTIKGHIQGYSIEVHWGEGGKQHNTQRSKGTLPMFRAQSNHNRRALSAQVHFTKLLAPFLPWYHFVTCIIMSWAIAGDGHDCGDAQA